MNKAIKFILLGAILIGFASCAVQKTAAEIEEEKRVLIEKLETQNFTFNATYVFPMGNFPPRHLTSAYDVKVRPDTVYSHLPYFGIAYEAPWNPSESPLIFNSKNFDFFINQGNKAGNWIVKINMYDRRNPLSFIFSIWDNGRADLVVWDSSRQTISFRGEIE